MYALGTLLKKITKSNQNKNKGSESSAVIVLSQINKTKVNKYVNLHVTRGYLGCSGYDLSPE